MNLLFNFALLTVSAANHLRQPVAAAASNSTLPKKGSPELLGYLENWVDVKWWDNNMPGTSL